MPQRLLAIVTDTVEGPDSIDELCRGECDDVEVRLVMPAVEESPLEHVMGSVDEPHREAGERLEASLEALRRRGIAATGGVGDPDPVLAAQDALREGPADEVVIFEHSADQARWFEEGLFDRAQEALPLPLRMVIVSRPPDNGGTHVIAVEEGDHEKAVAAQEESTIEISENLPRFSRIDLLGIVVGIVGTIVVAVLAAAAGSGTGGGWSAVAILIAIATALVNLAHVVGLLLFESVRYRGPWETFFRTLAVGGTPVAIVVNLAIVVFT
ncbi:MAG TPA: hypothetical protein VIT85_00235 [Solirubrobacterales bacterium]